MRQDRWLTQFPKMFTKGEDVGNREQVQPFFIGPGGLPNKNRTRARGGQSIGSKETVPEAVELWDYGIMGKVSWLQILGPLFLGMVAPEPGCLAVKQAQLTIMNRGQQISRASPSLLNPT